MDPEQLQSPSADSVDLGGRILVMTGSPNNLNFLSGLLILHISTSPTLHPKPLDFLDIIHQSTLHLFN